MSTETIYQSLYVQSRPEELDPTDGGSIHPDDHSRPPRTRQQCLAGLTNHQLDPDKPPTWRRTHPTAVPAPRLCPPPTGSARHAARPRPAPPRQSGLTHPRRPSQHHPRRPIPARVSPPIRFSSSTRPVSGHPSSTPKWEAHHAIPGHNGGKLRHHQPADGPQLNGTKPHSRPAAGRQGKRPLVPRRDQLMTEVVDGLDQVDQPPGESMPQSALREPGTVGHRPSTAGPVTRFVTEAQRHAARQARRDRPRPAKFSTVDSQFTNMVTNCGD